MKSLIALTVLLAGFTGPNQAAARSLRVSDADVYGLTNLQINPASVLLPEESRVQEATMMVDRTARVLVLTFSRSYYCPPNAICTLEMPAPVVIKLPITYIGSGFCGGQIISAEKDQRPVDGYYVGVTVYNDNGNFCSRDGDDRTFEKPVMVEFREQGPRDSSPVVSTMEGLRDAIESVR